MLSGKRWGHLVLWSCCTLTCLPGCGGDGGGTKASEQPVAEDDAGVGEDSMKPGQEPPGEDGDGPDGPGASDTDSGQDGWVGGDAGSDVDAQVTVGPYVASTLPMSGAMGVREDAVLVFTFSERMDAASTQAAYASKDLPADSVTFLWNDAGDTLTLIPKQKLAYAEGDASVQADTYKLSIGATATNTEGVPLREPASLTFSTLRRVTYDAPRMPALTGRVNQNGVATSSVLLAGDTAQNVRAVAVLSFDLAAVPSTIELERALILVPEGGLQGSPDLNLGALSAQHVVFAGFETAYAAKTRDTVAVERQVGVLGMPNRRTALVTNFVKDDLEQRATRNNRSQARFTYATATDNDNMPDYVDMERTQTQLQLVYLVE